MRKCFAGIRSARLETRSQVARLTELPYFAVAISPFLARNSLKIRLISLVEMIGRRGTFERHCFRNEFRAAKIIVLNVKLR